MNEDINLLEQEDETSSEESIQLEELIKERDNLKNLVEEQQKEINERELKARFKDTVSNDLKALYIQDTDETISAIEDCISFKDDKSFEESYKAIIKLVCEIKNNRGLSHYIPVGGNSSITSKTSAINQAFKPPKVN